VFYYYVTGYIQLWYGPPLKDKLDFCSLIMIASGLLLQVLLYQLKRDCLKFAVYCCIYDVFLVLIR